LLCAEFEAAKSEWQSGESKAFLFIFGFLLFALGSSHFALGSMPTSIHAVVITASDACSRGEREDKSGELLVELLTAIGAHIVAKEILADDLEPLADKLREYADRPDVNLIVTTGGTGFGMRDNMPEATLRVIERTAPGLVEAMRVQTLKNTPMAMISRGVSGIRSGALIVNLPGSPKAVRESFEVIKPVLNHAISLLQGTSSSHEE
jgi:molybdenum cofactor synthesis domain-containing protein